MTTTDDPPTDAAPALDGIRIVDATGYGAGPSGTRLLADWGASVTKIEHPVRGDLVRTIQHGAMRGLAAETEVNYTWEGLNRNKRSITLDLGHPDARAVVHRLIADADVFTTHFRPYELEKFGLDYASMAEINPRIVFASMTGYGRRGPDRDMPGFDWTAFWARSSAMHMHSDARTGPPIPRPAFGDNLSGLAFAFGIVTALLARERTGAGQEVDASLLGTGFYAMNYDASGALAIGADLPPESREDRVNPLALPYRTADGRWLMLCFMAPDLYWKELCVAIDRPDLLDDPRFQTFDDRARNHDALRQGLEEHIATRDLSEWLPVLNQAGVPWAPAQNLGEAIHDEQLWANEHIIRYDHPEHGPMDVIGPPVRLSRSPVTIRTPGPEFGQHTEEVLLEAGYSWEEILALKDAGLTA